MLICCGKSCALARIAYRGIIFFEVWKHTLDEPVMWLVTTVLNDNIIRKLHIIINVCFFNPIANQKSEYELSLCALIFCVRRIFHTLSHIYECCIVAHWWSGPSPPWHNRKNLSKVTSKHYILPQNALNTPIISCSYLSSVSTACLRVIATSSYIIKNAVRNNIVVPLFFVKLQIELSPGINRGCNTRCSGSNCN
jgi:hypothetical protein